MSQAQTKQLVFNQLYSQSGQDAVILAAMPDLDPGSFVEVGCIDGRRFSNTLALEERGWNGICIEAHPDYIEPLRRNRPNSRVFHAAVAEKDGDSVVLHANSRGTLSTLDPTLEQDFTEKFGKYFTGFRPIPVPKRSLSSILDEVGLPNPDVLTVDTEGCDPAVIQGLDISKHRPRLIIVESYQANDQKQIDEMLLPAGYIRATSQADDDFYFREASDLDRIAHTDIRASMVWTTHPLDSGPDQTIRTTISITRAA